MTKKDYIKVAQMYKRQLDVINHELATDDNQKSLDFTSGKLFQWRVSVESMARIFTDDNMRFNRNTFYNACGYVNHA